MNGQAGLTGTGPVTDVDHDPRLWTSLTFDPAADPNCASNGWTQTLSSHTEHPWRVDPPAMQTFVGFSRYRAIDDMRIVAFGGEGGLRGERARSEIERTSRHDLSIVYAAEGDMSLTVAGRDVELRRGMFTITDSARPMTLDIANNFRQVDLIFPKSRMLALFPFAEEFVGIPFGRDEGLLSFFIDHLDSIQVHLGSFQDDHAETLLKVTLDLLAMALNSIDPKNLVTPRDRMLSRIKCFIDANLANPDLEIAEIAEQNRINLRYLHKLFAETGVTAGTWIRRRRLEMCCRDLAAPALAGRSLTEIAFRWGFNDMSHFSKAFRREFGVSPREYRAARLTNTH